MRLRLPFVLLLVFAAGCAARRVVPPTVPTDWSVERALPPGTDVAVDLGSYEVKYGRVQAVSEQDLVIRRTRSLEIMARGRVERLAVRTPTSASRPIAKTALIAAAIAGGLMLFAKGMEENPRPDGGKWAFVAVGTTIGAGVGALRAPQQQFSERLVYIRR
jgi:hypothetical protein